MTGEVLGAPEAMARAVSLAARGPAWGPNPRVGCVITAPTGEVLVEGWHRGAGTAHAEAHALATAAEAGVDVAGATAYVTLEPCTHTGRTGPCADALTVAGIGRVIYAVEDPNPQAAGGGEVLRGRGIEAEFVPDAAARALNSRWLRAMELGRPYVIAKWAQTLDGRTAAADGTSFWITGEEARAHTHGTRAEVDAILVGTGTVRADDPSLSARPPHVADPHQPLRVVMGMGDTSGARVWRDGNAVAIRTHDPREVLDMLWRRDVRTLVVEGGSVVTSAFFRSGLVDEVHAYIAPALLGAGTTVVSDLGIHTMTDVLRGSDVTTTQLGADTLVTAAFTKGP
ncbi:bifunctional diaminohydroxyphosphoribosylaminopyrimidine deaminase/5-amino-6-(5-phosphoribosylamino)uracil reductase RibD [Demequina capsici]|uniref:Riboflavin biosynthesis protein RibD n=1 Tax=Demequina capsici TaxID=3075620 RepID=A0AA96J8V6_9MICO|nr:MULTISPECIES: bifunctional diaminohydroxyphosphoribosylaminopyrimidine deaminase/5-amino-6-(5-phosphoribosylamino)uracil reductase RibD [unclassified Demequina]WNM25800.1 bifunctional diaminohydroxyphosphoribosylaminopyrimidine deaminase/5-amino-6-(5-phosphoribosylamino)uracil reductase RibD [Demequina sp. OYTSA14]WNM28695.1 bifunctional diaminohydroxyphosphoribosylaminopyrimidine deaminase/5-amino-6-(5-phosphoribosylamino)uracil reductase RibD [Demequina sp. PMTSA13]